MWEQDSGSKMLSHDSGLLLVTVSGSCVQQGWLSCSLIVTHVALPSDACIHWFIGSLVCSVTQSYGPPFSQSVSQSCGPPFSQSLSHVALHSVTHSVMWPSIQSLTHSCGPPFSQSLSHVALHSVSHWFIQSVSQACGPLS